MTVIHRNRTSLMKSCSKMMKYRTHRQGQRLSDADSGDVAVFSDYLHRSGQPFVLLGEPGGQQLHLRFTGYLEGDGVVWDCRFVTLAWEAARCRESGAAAALEAQRSFIEVGQPGRHGVPLRVGLDLPCIDIPSVEKMIIMIRNYKRLRRGRHEFG